METNFGIQTGRYGINMIGKSISEALSNVDREKWIAAIDDEINSMKKNNTWILCKLTESRGAIGCKWLYEVKTDGKGNIEQYKGRFVAKG